MRKMTLFFLCLALVEPQQLLHAASARKLEEEQLEKMAVVLKIPQLHNQSIEHTKRMQSTMFLGSMTQSGVTKGTGEFQTKMMRAVEDELDWEKRKEEYLKVIAQNFTPEEVREIVAFFETPWGHSFLVKRELVQKQVGGIMNRKTKSMIPVLDEKNRRFLKVKETQKKLGLTP
jgi:hypothetical protein